MQQILFRQDSSRRESKIDNKVQVSVMRCEISKSTRVLYTSNKVPYLVVVVISTLPHLSLSHPSAHVATIVRKTWGTHNIAGSGRSISQIQTFTLASPGNALVGSNGELLIGISRTAGVDLHLDSVSCGPACDVETFVAVDDEVPVGDSPLGGNGSRAASLELNSSPILVGSSGQAHGAAGVRADSHTGSGGGGRGGSSL